MSTDWILEHIFACFFLYSDNSRAGEGGQRSDYLARPATIPRARAAETEPKGKSYHSAEALPALLALAEGQITDYQKSLALEQAAAAAVALKDFAQAGALAARIPIPAVQRTVEMQNLLAQTKAPQVVAQFAEEDIEKWPFWKRGDGYLVRGRAHLIAKNAKQAGASIARVSEMRSARWSVVTGILGTKAFAPCLFCLPAGAQSHPAPHQQPARAQKERLRGCAQF